MEKSGIRQGRIETMYADEDAQALLNFFKPFGPVHSSRNHHTLFPCVEGVGYYLLCMYKFEDNPNSPYYTVSIRFTGEEQTLNDKIRIIEEHHEEIFRKAREKRRRAVMV